MENCAHGSGRALRRRLDGTHVVRFPRTDDVARATQREIALRPVLADALSFAVPRPTHVGTWGAPPFFAYRRLPGEPVRAPHPPSIADAVGSMLVELHGFDVRRAAGLLGTGARETAWERHHRALWQVVETTAIPAMPDELAAPGPTAAHSPGRRSVGLPVTLLHGDLGPEHVLLDGDGTPSGLIDFEAASVGDPVFDLAHLAAILGPGSFEALAQGRDLGDRIDERRRFYRVMGSVHAIIYGVTSGDDAERRSGLEQLAIRLDEEPA